MNKVHLEVGFQKECAKRAARYEDVDTGLGHPPLGVQTLYGVCTLVKLGKNTEKISMAPA